MHKLSNNSPYTPDSNGKPKAADGRNLVISEGLSGSTSDHAYRLIGIEFKQGNKITSLKGATWNLMMFAKEQSSTASWGAIANNPFLETEDDLEFMERKIIQIELVLELLKDHQLDFMLLQEVDFIGYENTLSPWLLFEKAKLTAYFEDKLSELHFKYIKKGNLVTLYNTKTLTYSDKLPEQIPPFRGHRMMFKCHASSVESLVLTNMHLAYRKKYFEDGIIDKFLLDDTKEGNFAILGGDANYPLSSDEKPSNVTACMNPDFQGYIRSATNRPILTLQDELGRDKTYDGMIAKAPEGYTVTVTTLGGQYIELNNDNSIAQFKNLPRPVIMPPSEPEPQPQTSSLTIQKEKGPAQDNSPVSRMATLQYSSSSSPKTAMKQIISAMNKRGIYPKVLTVSANTRKPSEYVIEVHFRSTKFAMQFAGAIRASYFNHVVFMNRHCTQLCFNNWGLESTASTYQYHSLHLELINEINKDDRPSSSQKPF